MFFRLGTSDTRSEGEIVIRSQWDIHRDDAERPYSITEKWTLMGELIDTTSAGLLAKIEVLETNYNPALMSRIPFAGLYFTTNSPSHLYWDASASISGIEMTGGIRYPNAGGVQHLISRNYEIDLQAQFEIAGTSKLIGYQERISWKGNGGPRIAAIETRNTNPVFQQVSAKTACMLVQAGSATGRFDYPMGAVPPALYPTYLQNPEEAIDFDAPKMYPRGTYHDFTVRWNYMHIMPVRTSARPNFYPKG